MRTDPRLDQARQRDRFHFRWQRPCADSFGKVLESTSAMPSMPSYLLECMVLDYFDNRGITTSQFVDIEFAPLLSYIASAVHNAVQDPKYVQGDLNTLGWGDRLSISARASANAQVANAARNAERANDHKSSISLWRSILGQAFPSYCLMSASIDPREISRFQLDPAKRYSLSVPSLQNSSFLPSEFTQYLFRFRIDFCPR